MGGEQTRRVVITKKRVVITSEEVFVSERNISSQENLKPWTSHEGRGYRRQTYQQRQPIGHLFQKILFLLTPLGVLVTYCYRLGVARDGLHFIKDVISRLPWF